MIVITMAALAAANRHVAIPTSGDPVTLRAFPVRGTSDWYFVGSSHVDPLPGLHHATARVVVLAASWGAS